MTGNKRMKASDVFQKTEFLLSKKVSFGEAFPEIEDLTVEVEEISDLVWGAPAQGGKRVYCKERFPGEYVNCSNSRCYDGGFSLGGIIREMVARQATDNESMESCQGYEGSPKGRKRHRDCDHAFKIKVSITYKAA